MKLIDLTESEFLSEANRLLKKGRSESQDWRDQAREDFDFAAGNQWNAEDLQKLKDEQRPIITFNRCNVILSAILGLEANQRQDIKFGPRGNKNVPLAEALNEAAQWAREYGEIPAEETQAFEDMLTCGMGWSGTRLDYNEDLDGKIIQETLNALEMRWDPSARKRNLTDARWVARERKIPLDEIADLLKPGATIDLDSSDETSVSLDDERTSIEVDSNEDEYKQDGTERPEDEIKGVPVIHFQWYENVPVYRISNPMDGRIAELGEEEFKKQKDAIIMLGAPVIRQRKRKYYYAFFSKRSLLERGELFLQTGFSFKCLTGKRDHINKQWFGIIRLAKDPQRWANKFFSTFIDIMDSNAKGGILAETGAFEDPKQAEQDWNVPNSIVWLKPGAISQQRIQPRPVAQYPQMVDRLMTYSIQAIHDITGVNLELLGAVDRAEIGVVVDSRKRSAYTILAPFFDSLRNFRFQSAMALMECITKYLPAEKIAEMLSDKLKVHVQEIKALDLQRLKIMIAESPQSDNNRYQSWLFISQLLPQIMQMGIEVPPSVLDYSPLPAALIEEWKNMLTNSNARRKKQQMEETQKQLQLAKEQAEVGLKTAQAQKASAEAKQTEIETYMGSNVFGQS